MSKHVWIVQQSGVWGLDTVKAYGSEQAAMAQALELVVYWEDKSGQPRETKTRGLHRWCWPGESDRPDFTVLMIQTPVN
jgi:hypothetical protein